MDALQILSHVPAVVASAAALIPIRLIIKDWRDDRRESRLLDHAISTGNLDAYVRFVEARNGKGAFPPALPSVDKPKQAEIES